MRPGADVLIVGGGSAGCVLAARLTEDPRRRVCLVEAGGPPGDPRLADPLQWPYLEGGPFDWAYRTTPQPGTAGTGPRLAEGPRPGRLQPAQRHDPRPGSSVRLRRLGGGRRPGVEPPRAAARLPPLRVVLGRRVGASRRRRAHDRLAPGPAAPRGRGVHAGGGGGRVPALGRPQRPADGRSGAQQPDDPPRAARQRRRRVPRPGAGTPEPQRGHRRPRGARGSRERPGDRRRGAGRRRAADAPRRDGRARRGHRLVAPDPDAVGDRTAGRAVAPRPRVPRRGAGGRRAPARSPARRRQRLPGAPPGAAVAPAALGVAALRRRRGRPSAGHRGGLRAPPRGQRVLRAARGRHVLHADVRRLPPAEPGAHHAGGPRR